MEIDEDNYIYEANKGYSESKDFTSLQCWQKAREVRQFFYSKVIPRLPKEEKYNLDIQIRKAAVSTTANIAEGYGRYHYREGVQFYRISRGSLYELKDHLITCNDLKYVDTNLKERGSELIENTKIILNGYIAYVKNKI